MTLLVTLLLFISVGAATSRALGLTEPGTIAGRVACWYLSGIAGLGIALFVLGTIGVPVVRITVCGILVAAGVAFFTVQPVREQPLAVRHSRTANVLLWAAVMALMATAWVLPIRDYDGRVTWLPKARAIAHDGSVDGAFFQGQAGLNLHNEYPLLMPLNAAAVMLLTRSSEPEAVRWLFPLMAVAALLAARDLIGATLPRSSAWVISAAGWLPMLRAIEGGALSAYNDITVLALVGMSVVSLHPSRPGGAGIRAAALFMSALVLCKNEGVVLVLAMIGTALIGGRQRRVRDWAQLLTPVVASVSLLMVWRAQVPSAYDERYEVLMRTLPEALDRLPAALTAFTRHAADSSSWGWFWPVCAIAAVVALAGGHRHRAFGPLMFIALAAGAYSITFAVTSWDIQELAAVAASRLILHLVIPACVVLAVAMETLFDRLGVADGPVTL